jgi:hypothetical protein
MKKVLFLSIFLVSVLTSKNSFAQTDSIYALDAKIENGVLKGTFLSTYSINTSPQVVIKIYKNNIVFNDYIANFHSSDTTYHSKTGDFAAIINNKNIMEINFNQKLTVDESQKPIKIGFYIRPIYQNITKSNELFFLSNDITSLNEVDKFDNITNKKIYTLDGQLVNSLVNNTLYIVVEENNFGSSKKLFLNSNNY